MKSLANLSTLVLSLALGTSVFAGTGDVGSLNCKRPNKVTVAANKTVTFCDLSASEISIAVSRKEVGEKIVAHMSYQFVGLMKTLSKPLFQTAKKSDLDAAETQVTQTQANLWTQSLPQDLESRSAIQVLRILNNNLVKENQDPYEFIVGVNSMNHFIEGGLVYALVSSARILDSANPLTQKLANSLVLDPSRMRASLNSYTRFFCKIDADPCPVEQQILMRDLIRPNP